MSQSISSLVSLIKADMQHRCNYENKKLNTFQVFKFLLNPAALSTVIYRSQMFFYENRLGLIASVLKFFNGVFLTVNIDPSAKVAGGFFIMHCSHICIGPNVVIGRNCIMAHQNSVCPSPFYKAGQSGIAKGPVIGDGAILGAGATVTGEISLGNNVQVSMNAAVEESFPDNAVLFGVPAKNAAKNQAIPKTENIETSAI